MKRIISILTIVLCVAAVLSGNLDARRKSRDNTVYITSQEVRDLERSGLLTVAGKDRWKTRGGLLIAGRDPDGRTRLDHIMRHATDNPRRPKHGVFSLAKAGVIELLDEAWVKIRSGRVTGKERGGKVAYTVRMDRPVGYLGGREGRERNHPKLYSVRLVVQKDTGTVITFFPQ